MTAQELVKLVSDSGMGVLSFAALLYGGWKAAAFAQNFVENHMAHIQSSLDTLTRNSTDANAKLDAQTEKLDEILRK